MNKAISAEIRMCRHSRYGHSHISLFEVEVVKAELPEPGGNGGRSMLGQMRLRSDDDSKTLGGASILYQHIFDEYQRNSVARSSYVCPY